ncbi:MAG TPA: glucosamine-6-phosphate deaminase [Parafilimonas sp.]|nr:glucosamine-6-phosphate deaminase [Parafilimonas sp.]
MQLFTGDTYNSMSQQCADIIAEIIKPIASPLVCVPSGDSPKGLYKEWGRQQEKKIINVHDWHFLGLDEWIGLGKEDEGSCRFMLNRDLFYPLGISSEKICCFDGVTTDTTDDCNRIENFIRQHTVIDVAVLGLGMNGHVGLNEPGTSPLLRSHVSEIHPVTKEVGQKYFSSPQHLHRGITLGIATLMEARHVILIVSGAKKASILKQALEGEITPEIPASLLRNHANFMVFADKDAAGMLSKQ